MIEQDKGLSVRFFLHAVANPAKSKEEGRPIFDEVEMVSIMAPGNQKTEFTARANRMHFDSNVSRQWTYAERFAEHYEAFKKGIEHHGQGTPLNEVPFLTLAQKAEMKAEKIVTVEQLAAMPDSNIRRKGVGFRQHVDAAKAYLDTANGTASLSAEMAALRAELAALKGGKAPDSETQPRTSQFDGMAEEDLRNMLTDAGATVDGRWKKPRLIEEAEKLAAKATEAA